MKKQIGLKSVILLLFLSSNIIQAAENNLLNDYPHVILSNNIIETSIFLPDAQNGFYRASRFEWSGMIWQLTYKNHTYFTEMENYKPHDPKNTYHAISLAEGFLGGNAERLKEVNPGETFMIIGVGNAEKPDDGKDYYFATPYKIIDPGKWTVSHGKDWVEFTHELSDNKGYGYIYVKRMELTKGKPQLVIHHSLKNTGTRTLNTNQYCHNFFLLDNDNIGKNYQMDFFFPAVLKEDLKPYTDIKDNKMVFMQDLEGELLSTIEGYSDSVSHNHFKIKNIRTRAGVDITGDFAQGFLFFYANKNCICPEVFINISLEPGETQKWTTTYNFFEE